MGRLISIYYVYTHMIQTKVHKQTKIVVTGIEGFMRKVVTPFGNGAKVDCPKEYLGKQVYLIVLRD